MKKIQSGFTLIELMIVVAIIGILAAIAIPQYQNYVARAQVSEALSLASGGKVALSEYFNTTGEFPADNSDAGMAAATDIKGKYVTSVTVSADNTADPKLGILTALFGDDAHSLLAGRSMLLTGSGNAGSISWVCADGGTGGDALTDYLPSSCK
jgi:type IV pilus assembly protein PilA